MAQATNACENVYLIFVFDENILKHLKNKKDARLVFIQNALCEMEKKLKSNAKIITLYGDPKKLIPDFAKKLNVDAVFTNNDYEKYALERDAFVEKELAKLGVDFFRYKDQVIFEGHEVLNNQGEMYKVFTPYKKSWLSKLESDLDKFAFKQKVNLAKIKSTDLKISYIEKLSQIGFEEDIAEKMFHEVDSKKVLKAFKKHIDEYDKARDFPALDKTSHLSVHLRFGTISIRELVRVALDTSSTGASIWLSELCWRDFYFAILQSFPHINEKAYIKKYEKIKWENNKKNFKAWCEGKTGFPIVDAGMRQLNETGFMHNRLRMITASFLAKTLLVDWKWGEAYFAEKLIDFDFAANNGGWQWSASTGCDAAPYFRIFNPERQGERFDPEGKFIKKYCPELTHVPASKIHNLNKLNEMEQNMYECLLGKDYPFQIVDYKKNREKALDLYRACD